MTDKRIENLNIISCSRLITPEQLKRKLPITETAAKAVISGREVIKNILDRKDKRLFIVVGPCSIHDPEIAIEYGNRLRELADRVQDRLGNTLFRHDRGPRPQGSRRTVHCNTLLVLCAAA